MINLMKADLYRIFKGKAIYICLLILFASSLLSVYMLSPGHIGFNSSDSVSEEKLVEISKLRKLSDIRKYYLNKEGYAYDQRMMESNSNIYYFIVVIVVIVLGVDFSNHTIKNAMTTSISRRKYYQAKLGLSCILGLLLLLFNGCFVYLTNLLINGSKFSSSLGDVLCILLKQMPLFCGMIAILVCICFLTRKTALFNGIAIPLIMGSQLLLTLFSMIIGIKDGSLFRYEFEQAITSLTGKIDQSYLVGIIGLGIGYFIVSTVVGIYRFKHLDMK